MILTRLDFDGPNDLAIGILSRTARCRLLALSPRARILALLLPVHSEQHEYTMLPQDMVVVIASFSGDDSPTAPPSPHLGPASTWASPVLNGAAWTLCSPPGPTSTGSCPAAQAHSTQPRTRAPRSNSQPLSSPGITRPGASIATKPPTAWPTSALLGPSALRFPPHRGRIPFTTPVSRVLVVGRSSSMCSPTNR